MKDAQDNVDSSNVYPEDQVTGAESIVDALTELGVTHWFTNFGSDHASLIEALAQRRERGDKLPAVLICPHENTALSAAHGYALANGSAQAVIVHCDVGTQNLGGSVHNAARSRVPAFIFAGETPFSFEGELPGSRNRSVQHLQDVRDQQSIVRPYVKWSGALRSPVTAGQLVGRALQIANSEPKGPVYLTGAREVLADTGLRRVLDPANWAPAQQSGLDPEAAAEIVDAVLNAVQPLIITSYLGRNLEAVGELIRFAEALAIPVVEEAPVHMNFPCDHPLHLGYSAAPLLDEADVIIVIDCDVPWMVEQKRPRPDSRVFVLDIDPLKEGLLAWHMDSQRNWRTDSRRALHAMNAEVARRSMADTARLAPRRAELEQRHRAMRAQWSEAAQLAGDVITPDFLGAALRAETSDDTIVLDETITNVPSVLRQLGRNRPGSYFTPGGSSLGWNGGAAIGMKLARPDRTVLNLTGDGSYLLSVPSSVYWVARKYRTPFLTVIYNNRGWNATKQNVLRLHAGGAAERTDRYWINFDEPGDLAGIAAAAGGARAFRAERPDKLRQVLREALAVVREGQVAVVDVQLAPASEQVD
jgi:acetolactate synthase-1/2/3 large subunit